MVSCPRREVVATGEVGVYHVWTRVVRRAFLCGKDPASGQSFEHRRQWIHDFLQQLAGLTGVEVGFHAEMANHLHLVLRARPDVVECWSDQDVVRRTMSIERLMKSTTGSLSKPPLENEITIAASNKQRVALLRTRLSDISYFMKALCEYIGRRANREDHCTGHFFEGRFDCRRLESESAILVCGIYVDLNQIRAGEAVTPETSIHTSGYDRIRAMIDGASGESGKPSPDWMCELTLREETVASTIESSSHRRASDKGLLPLQLDDYLRLLDWSGRQVRADKRGVIPDRFAPILDRLGINQSMWTELITEFDRLFGRIVGRAASVAQCATEAGRQYYHGQQNCAAAFG